MKREINNYNKTTNTNYKYKIWENIIIRTSTYKKLNVVFTLTIKFGKLKV